jgi:hypothetical protein
MLVWDPPAIYLNFFSPSWHVVPPIGPDLPRGSHLSYTCSSDQPYTWVPCVGPTWHMGPTRHSILTRGSHLSGPNCHAGPTDQPCGSHLSYTWISSDQPYTWVPHIGPTWHMGPTHQSILTCGSHLSGPTCHAGPIDLTHRPVNILHLAK